MQAFKLTILEPDYLCSNSYDVIITFELLPEHRSRIRRNSAETVSPSLRLLERSGVTRGLPNDWISLVPWLCYAPRHKGQVDYN